MIIFPLLSHMNLSVDDRPDEDDMPDSIRRAMVDEGIEHYSMSLVDDAEIEAVIAAVNVGIDAHLTACNCPGTHMSMANDRSSPLRISKTGNRGISSCWLRRLSAMSVLKVYRCYYVVWMKSKAKQDGVFAVRFCRR